MAGWGCGSGGRGSLEHGWREEGIDGGIEAGIQYV